MSTSNGNGIIPIRPELPAKHQRFIDLLFLYDFNATKAYAEAYSAKETSARANAARLLATDNIQQAVAARMKRLADTTDVSVERVLLELKRMAYADIGEAYNPDGTLKALKDMPEDVRRAIVAVETEEIWQSIDYQEPQPGGGSLTRQRREVIGYVRKVKFADKRGSNELLGKYLKMFVERFEFGLDEDLLAVLQQGRERVAQARAVGSGR